MVEPSASTTMEMMLLSWDAPLRVLIVDDSLADYELTRAYANRGAPEVFSFEWAADYDAGLEAMLRGEHDVYVIDHDIAGRTGLELIREATVLGCDGPKVMCTGTVHPSIEGKAILAGAVDFLRKNQLDADSVVRLLRNTVARHRAFRSQSEEIERLLQSDTSLRIIVQHADGLVIVAADGLVHFVNPAAEAILGRRHVELVGTVLEVPLAGQTEEQTVVRPNGVERIVSVRSTSLLWEGEPCRVASVRDITEERAAREQLNHAQKMAVVGRLAGGVAHDFNNLLMGIMGSLELASSPGIADAERARRLTEARATAERAAELTRRLLGTARLHRTRSEAVDLSALVGQTSSILGSLVGDGIVLTLPVAEDCWVEGDPVELEQVLLNLVSNARDAMAAKGTLLVELERQGADVVLRVIDDGAGMSDEVADHIFEPFYTTKEAGSGTGLGLSIVYRVVQDGGGRIAVRSRLGSGTTIEIHFPGCAPVAPPPPTMQLDSGSFALGGSVLVVDDEPIVLQVVTSALREAGLSVKSAPDGLHAAALLSDGYAPQVLITDLSMPGMDGFDLADLARKLLPDLKVVFTTGFGEDVLERRDLDPADLLLLRKPFRLADVLETVRGLLRP